jgi:hypothetical protein
VIRAACLLSDVFALTPEASVPEASPLAAPLVGLAGSIHVPFAIPMWVSPGLAGILVGASSGVFLFGLVLLVRAILEGRDRSTLARGAGGADDPGLCPSAPHPLARIPADSSAMRALVDDSPTEISETPFDEPLRVLRRGASGASGASLGGAPAPTLRAG